MLLYAMSLTFSPQVGSLWRAAFIICVWFIWSTRNRFIFRHTGFTYQGAWKDLSFLISEVGENIVGYMNNSVQDLLVLRNFHVTGRPRRTPRVIEVRWLPPPPGWMKCNTDGSSDGAPGPSTAAGLFRNSRGFVHYCYVLKIGNLYAFEAELIAVMRGIQIAREKGWNKLWLESDSTYVVQLFLTRSVEVPWKYKNRWRNVLHLLSTMTFQVTNIYREGNAVADALSKHLTEQVWNGYPDFILPFLGKDMSVTPHFRYCV